ncbi:uncharacterized protein [Linepithema humile]|uniref:uncharacterized protein n=1 Tax=Linepithema humile TaxID=83485 RepID=UPI00351EA92A
MEFITHNQDKQTKTYLYCVLQYVDDKVWIKLEEPCLYEDFVREAKTIFPLLNNVDFIFTDVSDARLDPQFLTEFVQISARGVILKIKFITTNFLDISDFHSLTPTVSNSLYSRTSTPTSLNILDTSNKDEEFNEQCSNVTDISNIKEHTISDSEEHASCSKKPKVIPIENDVISKESLYKLIKNSSCGEEILQSYKSNKYLPDKYRKLLVKLVVHNLLQYKEKVGRQILCSEKCKYAKAIIEVFPNLKNPEGNLGYEHFYDPKTGKGYIASRLSNVQRKGNKKVTQSDELKQHTDTCVANEPVDETDAIKDAINFMKYATIDQKDNIIKKVKETFKVRRYLYLNEHFFETFPRFLDIPELIDIEFELLFPQINIDILNISYPDYVNHILNVYNTEEQNRDLLDWDRVTNSYIALTQLVPPTARGKKSAAREKTKNIIKKLIIYIQSATPLNIDENKSQPKLIAVGPNKLAIDQYFLKIDKNLILLPTKDIIKAVDYLFKAHYVFHIKYDVDLQNFWMLIQHYFYKISSKCTNKVVETFTKIESTRKESTQHV